MRVGDGRLPRRGSVDYDNQLYLRLVDQFREIATQLNLLSEGQVSAAHNAVSSAPTTTATPGDFVRNSNPVESGSASSKYVVIGWIYADTGWQEARVLTGN